MNINITPENLLVQLGYTVNEQMLSHAERIIDSTYRFHIFSKHIFSLKDELKHYDGYIALSSSRDAIKIKTDSNNPMTIEAYIDFLKHWSNRYKVELERVGDTNTYYIVGVRR